MRYDYQVIDVSEFGSLQAALDALPAEGGAVHVPTGVYPINQTLQKALAERQHLYLFGDGRGSVLVNECHDGSPLMHLTGVVGSWWPDLRITIRDIAFMGSPESGDALIIDYPNDTMVDACFFMGHGGQALRLGPQGTNVTVRDCWIRDCKRGIRAENIHHLTLTGTQTRSVAGGQTQGEHLFLGWECREVRVIGNHFAYGQAQGIILDGTAQHVIANNTIEGFEIAIEARGKGETVPRDHCRDMVISGNYLHANTGLLMRGECRGFVVQGNTFINNPDGAIVLQEAAGAGHHSITGNVIRKSVYDGVYVKTASPLQGGIDLGESEGCAVTGNVLDGVTVEKAIAAGGAGHVIEDNVT
ncbi:MAG: right-handed parallel beta-helix repeat-containing protein [Bacteroidota bacterium]